MACRRPMLALGGQLKATFALGRGDAAVLSAHLGDLDDYRAYGAYVESIAHYERLFGVRPAVLVHDLHPEYASTRHALERGAAEELPCRAVQHHEAHVASCMAEHGLDEPVIGVAFDGTGYGKDGTIWGGEFLIGDYREFRRAAHLRAVAMPGGERAIREPWRMAVSHLRDAGLESHRRPDEALRIVHAMIDRSVAAPSTTSMGRLFDAVASLAGVRDEVTFEGQAAMQLEGLASELDDDGAYPFALSEMLVIDTRPIVQAVSQDRARGVAPPRIARRFHSCVVEIIGAVCTRLREQTAIEAVVLSGGVFMNAIVSREAQEKLRQQGFRVHTHARVPANDGGLCLGQLAIAAALED